MVKKIAFCLRDMQIGGVENVFIRTLEQLLLRDDVRVSVITYAQIKTPIYAKWFAEHPDVKVYNLYPCRWLGTDLTRVFLLRGIQHLARDIYRWVRRHTFNVHTFDDIDVFVDYYNFSFANELRRFHQPKITWWHSSWNVFNANGYIKYLSEYDMMVALTEEFATDFRCVYPEYAAKVTHIYNPVDITQIVNRASVADVPAVKDYFVCVSRLARDKDIETVLRAFDLFWSENNQPDVHLVVIGGGSLADKFHMIANSLSSHANILFTGAMANPMGYIKGAMANVLSSYSEGLPTVLVEAVVLNTLNISSDCKNGPRDILLDGHGGILFTPGNVQELADGFSNVWKNKSSYDDMRRCAYNALDRFDVINIIAQIVSLVNDVTDKN